MDAYLLDAVRTPFGRHRGGLAGVRVDDLAALPIAELTRRNPGLDPALVDEVVYGNTNGAGEENRNIGRMAALLAGLPVTVPGVTVNRLCASGGEAVVQAARLLAVGAGRIAIAGGVEGMSRAPFVVPRPEEVLPQRMEMVSTALGWRLVNPKFPAEWTASLGACAEQVAADLGIGRAAQDEWALRSHRLASTAWDNGSHDWVLPVGQVSRDEALRPDTSAAALARLRPAFSPDGAVTAGNSSPLSDGALAALLSTRAAAAELGLEPLARIKDSTTAATDPHRFAVAPVPAILTLLHRNGLSHRDIARWEINEAFAAMVLSTLDQLAAEGCKLDTDLVNPDGGAIALGHPLGASMPRAIVDCARGLRRRGGGLGVVAACIGVGQGMAVLVQTD
ncbi:MULTISPECIES: thiolase family protein [unclassified Crossiella]|uniref:thiolase family protein n=1 Tax=unclassified Crossiella TaxID=2620835 RepID=UPI002000475F|nr:MULTISPECIES: thiolase family protein [unclassified Crossiella]MCK2242022.1 thiolase family protein [Crossiella sp. S99.2]MCK2255925.1 thiolase family protein [Crossiella sp. S99.1]